MQRERRVSALDLYKIWPLLRNLEGERLERAYSYGEVIALATGSFVLLFSPRRGPALISTNVHLPSGTQRLKLLQPVEGRRIVAVEHVNGDRVISLELHSFSVVLEWVREGNVLLLDASEQILSAMRPQRLRDRSLVKGELYRPPPKQGDAFSDPPGRLFELFRSSGRRNAVTSMSLATSLPADVVFEAFYRGGVATDLRAGEVSETLFQKLLALAREVFLEGLLDHAGGYRSPAGSGDIYPFPATHAGAQERFEGYAERLFELIASLILDDIAPRAGNLPVKEVEEALRSAEAAAGILREFAWRVDEILERYRELKSERVPWASMVSVLTREFPEVTSVNPAEDKITLKLKDTYVEVLATESAAANAGRYYEKAKALRRRLEELRSRAPEAPRAVIVAPKPRRGGPWYAEFRSFTTTGGFLVVAGRTAGQNELLVRRYMDPGDIFLHADIHGAPATVIKTQGREPSDQDLAEAAQFAACYSSAWKAGLYTVDVIWVRGSQVSKSPPSGEYLSRGSFMIYGKRNYIRGVKLELLVGYSAPVGLVALPALASPKEGCFVKLTPGRLSRDLAARKVAEFIRRECGIRGFRSDEVIKLLPEGGFHVERWKPS